MRKSQKEIAEILKVTEATVSKWANEDNWKTQKETDQLSSRKLITSFQTLLEKLLEELSFAADEVSGGKVTVNQGYVRERLSDIVQDQDLSRFIL